MRENNEYALFQHSFIMRTNLVPTLVSNNKARTNAKTQRGAHPTSESAPACGRYTTDKLSDEVPMKCRCTTDVGPRHLELPLTHKDS